MNFGFYIVFICDGIIIASWHYPLTMNFEIDTYPLLKPIILMDTNTNYEPRKLLITNLEALQTTIMEGNILDPQPIIRISNTKTGVPITNVPIFAVLVGYIEDGVEYYFPFDFQYQKVDTYAKRLIKPIAAEYNENYADPFASWLFRPRLTDQDGTLQFEGLTLTTKGNVGITGCIIFIQLKYIYIYI